MSSIDQAQYRRVLGRFPTGVTVVAGMADGSPVGLAVGLFFSVSIDPPLVGFCVGKASTSWKAMEPSGSFCINVLGADQEDVCGVFASSGTDKFAAIDWAKAESGSPLINDVLAWIDCDLETIHDGGDHHIVVARVRDLDVGRERNPLVFLGGAYANLT